MSLVTYYFNAYDSGGEEWETTPANMVDGNTANFASTDNVGEVQLLTGNTCDGTDLGEISKVELRAFVNVPSIGRLISVKPVFPGGDGDASITFGTFNGWTSYQDITSDTNAPGTWDWNDVQTLDCDISIGVGLTYASKVEIRVTYTPPIAHEKNWAETTTLSEPGLLRNITTTPVETATVSEVYTKNTSLSRWTETATLSEVFVKLSGILFSDNITLSDSIVRQITKTPTETVNLSEIYIRNWSLLQTLSDTATLSEVAQRQITFLISEVLTLTDLIIRLRTKIFTDTSTLSEIFSRAIALQKWVETATLTDTILRGQVRVFISDIITISDYIIRWKQSVEQSTTHTKVDDVSSGWVEGSEESGGWTGVEPNSGSWTENEGGIPWPG